MQAQRNLNLFIPYLLCSVEGICHGIYILWLTQNKGLTPMTAALLLSFSELGMLFLELPTGMFADRFGLRRSLIGGSLFQIVGLLLLWLAHSLPGLALGGLCISLGDALRHGADEALLYRSCARLGREHEFAPRLARAHAFALGGMVAMLLLGGWLAHHVGFALAWGLEVALSITGLGLALAFDELTPLDPEAADSMAALRSLPWALILPAALVTTLSAAGEFLVQVGAANPARASLAVAALLLLEALGAELGGRLPVCARTQHQLLAAGLLGAAIACLPGGLLWGAALVFVVQGMAPVVRSALIQAQTPEGQRATVASAAGTLDVLGHILALPLAAPRPRPKR